jgi:hypothetical protein
VSRQCPGNLVEHARQRYRRLVMRALRIGTICAFVALHASAGLALFRADYPLTNVLFFASFALALLVGLLIGRWWVISLCAVMPVTSLVKEGLEGETYPLSEFALFLAQHAVIFGPFLGLGVLARWAMGELRPEKALPAHPGKEETS